MKRFKYTAPLLTAVFSIAVAVSGCGKGNSDGNSGAPGSTVPGFGGGVVTPLPGGGAQVAFQGANVYNSNIIISGGQISDYPNPTSSTLYYYCGYFTGATGGYGGGYGGYGSVKSCWYFSNKYHQSSQLVPANAGVPVGAPGSNTYTGTSTVEAGATVTIVATTPQTNISQSLTGIVVLPPAFVMRNFPQGLPPVIGLAVDFGVSTSGAQPGTSRITGGVLVYTSQDQYGFHGAFLSIQ